MIFPQMPERRLTSLWKNSHISLWQGVKKNSIHIIFHLLKPFLTARPAGPSDGHRPLQSLGLAVTSKQSLGELLHHVNQEEAGAEDQLGQELQLQAGRFLRQALDDLRKHVEQGGGQDDAATKTWQHRRYHCLTSSNSPIVETVFTGELKLKIKYYRIHCH